MPLFTLECEDPIFSVAFHPEKQEFVVGYGTGRVSAYKYTYESDPQVIWTTKRHKSSCRGAIYSQDGKHIYTAGSDQVVKKAASDTGKVVNKTLLEGVPSTIVLNSHYLFIGDDDGHLQVLDLDLKKTHRIEDVVPDCVNSIATLDHKNQYSIIVTGMSSLAHVDIRKGIRSTSEDQEDEILCVAVPNERRSVCGMSEGVLTIWNNDHLLDQQNRIRLIKDGTIDSVLAGETENVAFAGTSEGSVFQVDTHACKIISSIVHALPDEGEEVSFLDWDCDYHLVTGSLSKIILWEKGEQDQLIAIKEDKPKESSKKNHKRKGKKAKNTQPDSKRSKMFADL